MNPESNEAQTTGSESAAPSERDPRLCSHPGKDGTGCKAYKAQGYELCAGHAGLGGLDAHKASQRSVEVRSARALERAKTLKDRLAEKVEARAERIAALIDHDIERKDSGSVRSWIEQVYGKPQQTVVTEDGSKPAEELGLAELEALRRRILDSQENVTELRSIG